MKQKLALLLFIYTATLGGCAIEPWVKPYERSFNRDPVSASYIHHVYDSREGARGAGIATGGGCGCN
jgi:hypothetical protein